MIAIIGILATVVIASLNGAREKAKSAAIKSEARQLFNLAMEHYAETGDFTKFLNNSSDWVRSDSQSGTGTATCSGRVHNDALNKEKAIEICNSITNKLPTNLPNGESNNKLLIGCSNSSSQPACNLQHNFSIQVKLKDSDTREGNYFCIGSSGASGEYPSADHLKPGCFYNP